MAKSTALVGRLWERLSGKRTRRIELKIDLVLEQTAQLGELMATLREALDTLTREVGETLDSIQRGIDKILSQTTDPAVVAEVEAMAVTLNDAQARMDAVTAEPAPE